MSDYIISCCSTVDLTREQLESRNISYICCRFELDGKEYVDDGDSISHEELYRLLADGADVKTSQINIEAYHEYFNTLLDSGKDVLHIALSSGLSGTFNSARNAARMAEEEHPGKRIIVVDSLGASSGSGMLVEAAADLRADGADIDTAAQWLHENRLRQHYWFFSTDLRHFIRGGRLSKAAGAVASVLGICPLLTVDTQGHLVTFEKVRTKRRVKETIVARMLEHADGGSDYSGRCYISHSACYEDAKDVADLIESAFPGLAGKVRIFDIGATVGCHCGPGTVALFFTGDERTDK